MRTPLPSAGPASAGSSAASASTPINPATSAAPNTGSSDPRFKGLKVLVAGATGGVGREVVSALLARGVPVRALVRDATRAAAVLPSPPPGGGALEVVVGDVFQYATLPAALGDANAVVVATGARDPKDPFGPFNIDYEGTLNLLAAAKAAQAAGRPLGGGQVKRFVLVTSIGADDYINPLNLFWGVLFWKKRAEEEVQRSGLDHTIIRPGGLKNKASPGDSSPGGVVLGPPGKYGFPPGKESGSILRSQVAELCVEALVVAEAGGKVLEAVAKPGAAQLPLEALIAQL